MWFKTRMKLLSWFAFLWAFSVSGGRKACSPGSYWDSGLDKCDPCSSICDFMEQQGTVKTCRENCPDYKSGAGVKQANEQPIENNGASMIVPVVVCVSVGVICSIVVAGFLLRWRRLRNTDAPSNEPTLQPPSLPHSSVTYVALPIHTQAEDTATSLAYIGAPADLRRDGEGNSMGYGERNSMGYGEGNSMGYGEGNSMGYPDLPARFEPIGDISTSR